MNDRGLREIRVPQLGEGLREARVVELLREPGSTMRRGDPLYVIETDKTTVELEVPFDGMLVEWRVAAGDVVAIDTTIAIIAPAPGENGVGVASTPTERLIPRVRATMLKNAASTPRCSHRLRRRQTNCCLRISMPILRARHRWFPRQSDIVNRRSSAVIARLFSGFVAVQRWSSPEP